MVIVDESVLDVIADVVEAARTYISRSSFKLVDALFHLCRIFLSDTLGHLVHALIQRHYLQSLEHGYVE